MIVRFVTRSRHHVFLTLLTCLVSFRVVSSRADTGLNREFLPNRKSLTSVADVAAMGKSPEEALLELVKLCKKIVTTNFDKQGRLVLIERVQTAELGGGETYADGGCVMAYSGPDRNGSSVLVPLGVETVNFADRPMHSHKPILFMDFGLDSEQLRHFDLRLTAE